MGHTWKLNEMWNETKGMFWIFNEFMVVPLVDLMSYISFKIKLFV